MANLVPEHLTYDFYTDGGCIKKNPSALGGTWSWCLVDKNGKRLDCAAGIITPKDIGLPTVSNNVAELYATLMALESAPKGWAGILYTDSKVTLLRLTTSDKFNGVPLVLRDKCLRLRRWRQWSVVLLGGHPSKSDLEVGYDHRGLPVSRHNQFCDDRCRSMAERFLNKETA